MCNYLILVKTDEDGDALISLSNCALINWLSDKSGVIYYNYDEETTGIYFDADSTVDSYETKTEMWKLMSLLDNLPRNTPIPVIGS
jgi:hypothetical protein